MRTQQQADKEEQQRIKNLVLNYDLRENDEQDGDHAPCPLVPNTNIHKVRVPGPEKPTSYHYNRMDKSGKDRGGRARKLQLSDVDWYGRSQKTDSSRGAPKVDNQTQPEVNQVDYGLRNGFVARHENSRRRRQLRSEPTKPS
jgi:regulator of nonsense transcripts 2